MRTDSTHGLWRDGRRLVIDPNSHRFPNRCVFTNEPTSTHTPITLRQLSVHDKIVTTTYERVKLAIPMPVSETWKASRKKLFHVSRIIAAVLGIICTVAGGIYYSSIDNMYDSPGWSAAMAISLGAGPTALFLSIFWKRFVANDANVFLVNHCKFLENVISVPKISKEFLADLPDWNG